MSRIVFVEGNIVAYKGWHVAKGFVALATDVYKENAVEIINGDLNLYKEGQLIPYYIYAARYGVTAVDGNLGYMHAPANVLDLYKSEIDKIKRISSLPISDDLKPTFNRQLFIGVISALELFITELITCLVLGDEYYYHKFIKNTDYKVPLKDIDLGRSQLDKAIYNVIHNINTHRIKEIKILLKDVFDVVMPNTTDLGRFIKIRHDLVHRSGYKTEDRSLHYINVTDDFLKELIKVSEIFVDEMMCAFEKPIKHWEDGLY